MLGGWPVPCLAAFPASTPSNCWGKLKLSGIRTLSMWQGQRSESMNSALRQALAEPQCDTDPLGTPGSH